MKMEIITSKDKRTVIYRWGQRFLAAAGPFTVESDGKVSTEVLFEVVRLVRSLGQALQRAGLFPYPFGVASWLFRTPKGYYFLVQGGPNLIFSPPPSPPREGDER